MIKYDIKSRNLNDSLVFYRALFNKMPDLLSLDYLRFNTDQFQLEITEGISNTNQTLLMEINDGNDLKAIHNRMSRFLSKERLKEDCEVIQEAIGLIDPDGNHWRVGDPNTEVQFEKCYVTH
ncbi:MAG: hypothetical protein ABJG47_07415 [Ekhidna sp.]